MQKNSTLSEIANLMGRIGCFNKARMDDSIHKAYLKENIENEDWRKGARSQHDLSAGLDYKNSDYNNKIQISPSQTVLYNCSPHNVIPSIIEQGPSWEYCKKHAYGKGVYTNLQEYQAVDSAWIGRQGYGDTICKYVYNGDIMKEFLVLIPQLWGKSGDIVAQCERFKGFKEELLKQGVKPIDLQNMSRGDTSATAAQYLIRFSDNVFPRGKGDRKYHSRDRGFYGAHIDDALMKYGIQGFIYYGNTDGATAIVFNTDKLQLVAYETLDNRKFNSKENITLDWKRVPEGKGKTQQTSDSRPFLLYFQDKFEGNPLYLRPYCGEFLVIDKVTKKNTFIDVEKGENIIRNQSKEDPRLFGDFEFDNAQKFMNFQGKELAFVQIDKDPESQYYIDKEGYLYKNPSKYPISHIEEYYPDADEPVNNDIEDDSDYDFGFDDEEEFNNFKSKFGESIMRIVNEALQDESRTETQDGHVELDNFDLARNLMKFNGSDDAYFIQLVERHKDHPDRHYEQNACAYKSFFEVVSIEHLNAIEPIIKRLCQNGEWRAMLYINPRPMGDTREYASGVLEPRFKRHKSSMQGHEIEVAYGQSKDWPNRPLCFVDVDNNDPQSHKQVLDYIEKMGIKPLDMYNSTNNGLHIILPDKEEARKLDFSFLDKGKNLGKWSTATLEIDKSITLYAYVKAQGYGTQKRMQQKLGGK
jgi:hypothetical protein